MEISRHICFRREDAPELADYLTYHGIAGAGALGIITLDILESDPHYFFIWNIVQQKHLSYLSETIFTKEELRGAAWLRVRSQWRFGYPQPEAAFEYDTITYSPEDRCPKCNCGLKQVQPFRIKKVPKWGKRYFGELNWIGDELFLNDTAKEVLEKSGLTGIRFLEVQNKKGAEAFPDIHQLQIPYLLEQGMPEDQGYIQKANDCPACGRRKYVTSGVGMLRLPANIFRNAPDFVKTAEYFGDGLYSTRTLILSQQAYRVITENKLDRGLVFEPIELV